MPVVTRRLKKSQSAKPVASSMMSATSDANARFKERLEKIPFDMPFSALSSFAFEECEEQPELTALVRGIT